MCDKTHYEKCAAQSRLEKNPPSSPFVFAYVLDPNEEKQRLLENAAKARGTQLICVTNASVTEKLKSQWRLPLLQNVEVEDWLWLFKNAEAVVTDSFHGACFSVIFERPFIVIENEKRGSARFASMLSSFGLVDRLVSNAAEGEKKLELLGTEIDAEETARRLSEQRAVSGEWLKQKLTLPVSDEKGAVELSQVNSRRIDLLIDRYDRKLTELESLQREQKQLLSKLSAAEKRITELELGGRIGAIKRSVKKVLHIK